MFKIFEAIGTIIAIACLIEMASNPKQVVRDIQNGPVPHLSQLNNQLLTGGTIKSKGKPPLSMWEQLPPMLIGAD